MFTLTPQERQVVAFIFLSLCSGLVLQAVESKIPLFHKAVSVMDETVVYPRVNINTAGREELIAVPFIGPMTADLILRKRPFKELDELRVLLGRREENFYKMKTYIKVN